MILPANIAQEISEAATRSGADSLGGEHYQIQHVPQALQDTPHACIYKTADLAVWDYPQQRALLLARPGSGELALYPSQAAYETALQSARRGKLPGRGELELSR